MLVYGIEVEGCADEDGKREYHYDGSYYPVDQHYAIERKEFAHLVDEPRETVPPEQCSSDDAEIS